MNLHDDIGDLLAVLPRTSFGGGPPDHVAIGRAHVPEDRRAQADAWVESVGGWRESQVIRSAGLPAGSSAPELVEWYLLPAAALRTP